MVHVFPNPGVTLIILILGFTACDDNAVAQQVNPEFRTEVRQITNGPQHHFFGYIGHVQTIPWNASGRYIVALQTDYHDRMPSPDEPAEIVLIDMQDACSVHIIEQTRAWNFQQGTMLYWNPENPENQFFFNDRDPETHQTFCVLFDISIGDHGKRIAEFRFPDTPFSNSGVAQNGGYFLGINYGRLARLRPVTGYPGAFDWTAEQKSHPTNDGIFKVNAATREKQLLVSFAQLADTLRPTRPDVDQKELFINHTLWSRDDSRIYFFVRGDFEVPGKRLDVPFVMNSDGSQLQMLSQHIGGHPEWESGHVLIGRSDKDQIRFDTERQEIVGRLGTPEIFPDPNGDVALSPDGELFVNGHSKSGKNYYTILRRRDGTWTRTVGLDKGGFSSGELRIDPSPCWNRRSNQILMVAIDEDKTRQLQLISILPGPKDRNP